MRSNMNHVFSALLTLAWNTFIIGGCAYLVFWRGESAWWFLLAVILLAATKD